MLPDVKPRRDPGSSKRTEPSFQSSAVRARSGLVSSAPSGPNLGSHPGRRSWRPLPRLWTDRDAARRRTRRSSLHPATIPPPAGPFRAWRAQAGPRAERRDPLRTPAPFRRNDGEIPDGEAHSAHAVTGLGLSELESSKATVCSRQPGSSPRRACPRARLPAERWPLEAALFPSVLGRGATRAAGRLEPPRTASTVAATAMAATAIGMRRSCAPE